MAVARSLTSCTRAPLAGSSVSAANRRWAKLAALPASSEIAASSSIASRRPSPSSSATFPSYRSANFTARSSARSSSAATVASSSPAASSTSSRWLRSQVTSSSAKSGAS